MTPDFMLIKKISRIVINEKIQFNRDVERVILELGWYMITNKWFDPYGGYFGTFVFRLHPRCEC